MVVSAGATAVEVTVLGVMERHEQAEEILDSA